jgi:lipid A 3-O-deacylase
MKWRFIFCLIVLPCLNVQAQQDSLPAINQARFFALSYDNDFFRGTDRYYTQGIIADLAAPILEKNPLVRLLLKLPGSTKCYGIKIEQDVFSPKSIRHDSVYYGERPYSAVFFLSSYAASLNADKKQGLSSEVWLGLIGPFALGEQEQKAIHKGLNNIQPLGWEYQIKNDLVINYNARIEKGLAGLKHFGLNAIAGIRAGTLYDDADIGFRILTGIMHPPFENEISSRNKNSKKLQCYFSIQETARIVGYNATLQGGLLNRSSVYTLGGNNISRLVSTTSFQFVIAYKKVSLEYALTYITREFKTGLDHGWGHCRLKVLF